MRGLRKYAVLQAACLLMTGGAVMLPGVPESAAYQAEAWEYEDEGDWEYVRYQSGYVDVARYWGSEETVYFPREIAGMPVKTIGAARGSAVISSPKVKSVIIPDTVEYIGNEAFRNCDSLEWVTLPQSVKHIGEAAFQDCESLKAIKLPKELDRIWPYTFEHCTALERVQMPETVQMIELAAFRDCSSLTEVEIHAETRLNQQVFKNCTRLKTVTLGEGVCLYDTGIFENCKELETVILPDSVTQIPREAFYKCSKLSSVTIPDTCFSIGMNAFNGCQSLTEITLPAGLKQLGQLAFAFCKGLKKVTFLNPEFDFSDCTESEISDGWENGTDKYGYKGVICGYEGSTAQEYAEKYKRTFESLGEVPVTTTTAPVTTAKPAVTTAKPTVTTAKPAVTTAKPAVTTAKPVTTVSASATAAPVTTTTTAGTPYRRGDVTGDGLIGVEDAQIVLKEYTEGISGKAATFSEQEKTAGDVDGNNRIGVEDAQWILKYYTENTVAGKRITWEELMK